MDEFRTKEAERQEKIFLELCSEPYKEMVQGKREMSINDFERLRYAISALDLFDYCIYFSFHYEELSAKAAEKEELLKKVYDSHYSDGDNFYAKKDKWDIWLKEFWEQIPLESQKKKYKVRFLD